MRILHISSAKTFGGGERHLVDLTRELNARGHEIFVALRPTNEWQERLAFLDAERFLHVSIRNSFGMFSVKRIGRFIERNQIDIIHAHVARDYLAASIAARVTKDVKMILTRHVMFPMKPFHRFALRNVDAAIGVSGPVGEQLGKIFPAEKVRVIANGIAMLDDLRPDAGDEFRAFHSIPPEAPLVVTVGELIPLKGQREFVLAAAEVVEKIPDCRFVVVGRDNSIDKNFRRELKRLVKVFEMEDKFLWLDWLDDLSPLLAAADLFVSPSHSESFGLAILDAMAAGRAVVATGTHGARSLIDDENALVPVKEVVALADRITFYLENRDARESLAMHLRGTALSKFGLARMIDETEELYRTILAAND